jgi:DNA-binding MarR family transcriptional regulator
MAGDGEFDEVIHAPLRLRICGLLRSAGEVDFAVVRDTLETNDVTLSKHLKVLTTAGLVSTTKAASTSRNDSRRVTWLALTAEGRRAFDGHVRALRAIAAGSPKLSSPAAPRPPTTGDPQP